MARQATPRQALRLKHVTPTLVCTDATLDEFESVLARLRAMGAPGDAEFLVNGLHIQAQWETPVQPEGAR
jgi:hypothetical protein